MRHICVLSILLIFCTLVSPSQISAASYSANTPKWSRLTTAGHGQRRALNHGDYMPETDYTLKMAENDMGYDIDAFSGNVAVDTVKFIAPDSLRASQAANDHAFRYDKLTLHSPGPFVLLGYSNHDYRLDRYHGSGQIEGTFVSKVWDQ